MKHLLLAMAACLVLLQSSLSLQGADAKLPEVLDIPFQKIVLPNGLTLIIHEDRKTPIVAVNVWYHVGSKNEKVGRTGFAHLFEHLMFNGSENFNDDYFQAMEGLGATDMNGTTNEDRTNYFENVPKTALDVVLWLESDRMGHFKGAITQERLDEQRGVVQNEKRQGENQPYGRAHEIIVEATYPARHPYSWTVIGSMEDLNAASLADVKEWFENYYGAANAVIVLAGDIDAQTAKEKISKYFGHIPSGPPLARHQAWVAKRTGSHRQIMHDRVPQARIYKVWNIPQYGTADADYLNLVTDVLGAGKNSRLYERLVYRDQIATSVSAFVDLREVGGQLQIVATARPGQDLAKVEQAVNEELQRFLKEGPTDEEMTRIKTQFMASFIRGAERIGGFGGKSDILAMNEVFMGDPEFYKVTLKRTREATKKDLVDSARAWLSDGDFNLEVHPFPEYKTAKSEVDRSKLPTPGAPPDASFPKLERAELDNGLKIIFARRTAIPVVTFDLQIDAGYAADQFAAPGTAKLSLDMLDEGTKTRSALEISDELAQLGASLGAGSNLDSSSVFLSALKVNLDKSLEIFGDVVLNPSFPEADFKRLQKLQLDGIQREKVQPFQMALRVFPKLLYGDNHAYSTPFTGSGNADTVSKLTTADVKKFHETWFKPNNSTLIIVGDTTLDEIKPKIQKLLGNWKRGDVPRKNISQAPPRESSTVYLMDRPGSIQSVILAGHIAPPKDNPDEIAIETMNEALGGMFTSRLNMNLREDKHWSYGARTVIPGARGQRPFIAMAPVQTDKTKESMVEVLKELQAILKDKPLNDNELQKVQRQQTLQLAGVWETADSVSGSIAEIVRFGLPDNYWDTYVEKVRGLSLEQANKAAVKVIQPKNLVWIIVGDRAKIEAGIRELGFGELRLLDSDGRVIQ